MEHGPVPALQSQGSLDPSPPLGVLPWALGLVEGCKVSLIVTGLLAGEMTLVIGSLRALIFTRG